MITVQVLPAVVRRTHKLLNALQDDEAWRRRPAEAMTEVWPDYDEYQNKTGRAIPVVVLERAS